jgi:hypothetical protein
VYASGGPLSRGERVGVDEHYRGPMRWEALFDDLERQFLHAARLAEDEEVADLAEAEQAQVSLADRLRARHGREVTLRLRDGSDVSGTVVDAAVQWLLVADAGRRVLVPTAAVAAVRSLGAAAPEAPVVERRLRLTHVLRAVAREQSEVVVRTTAGDYRGRLTRVAADHVDVATEPGTAVAVALAHVLAVQTG